jgi:hypothetical protein
MDFDVKLNLKTVSTLARASLELVAASAISASVSAARL